jgi:hypothetical protein
VSTWLATGCTPSVSSAFSSSFSSSGLPPVAAWHAQAPAHELADGYLAQRPRVQRHRERVAEQFDEERRVDAGLVRAQARGCEHRQAFEPAHEEGEEAQRRPVAPVQVVDREQQRLLGAQVDGEPVEAVQHRERAVGLGAGVGRDRLEQHPGRGGGAGEQPLARARVGEQRLEELADDAECVLALELAAARAEHAQPGVGRAAPRLAEQLRLADAGGALDDHEPGKPGRRLVDERRQRVELLLAFEQARRGSSDP